MNTALFLRAAGTMLCLSTSGLADAQATATPADIPGNDVWIEADAKARAIVGKLTLDEKVAQLLNTAPAIPRLDIPAYNWWTESLHGALGPVPTTNFPEPIGLAATFNRPLMHQVADAGRGLGSLKGLTTRDSRGIACGTSFHHSPTRHSKKERITK